MMLLLINKRRYEMLKKVKIKNLTAGMKIVNHLSFQGKKILSGGTKLSKSDVEKIQSLGIPENVITVELSIPVITNSDGSVDTKSTFTNLVMDLRSKVKKNK